jgi:hypothetical protein
MNKRLIIKKMTIAISMGRFEIGNELTCMRKNVRFISDI